MGKGGKRERGDQSSHTVLSPCCTLHALLQGLGGPLSYNGETEAQTDHISCHKAETRSHGLNPGLADKNLLHLLGLGN